MDRGEALGDASGNTPLTESTGAGAPAVAGSHRRGRRTAGIVVAVLLVVAAILAIRYVPAFLDARAALNGARELAAESHSLGVRDLNAATLTRLHAEVDALRRNIDSTRTFLASDPLVGLVRLAPGASQQLDAAAELMNAAAQLGHAADVALGLGDGFISVRQGAPGTLLGGLVSLAATSSDAVSALRSDLDGAQVTLAGLPPLTGQLRDASDSMAAAIARLRPLIDQYDTAAGLVPDLLGWGGQRRYLVLAEDPAELRPAGGYTGTFGILTFQNGNLMQHTFTNVEALDLKQGPPFVQPPTALSDHLLGPASWQLGDANWSPDWPTSAQDALRLYTNESGDTHIDGVIALTTYALDGILSVTGPLEVPGYGVTVESGRVTITALQNTRAPTGQADRKAFLDALAGAVLDRLQALPPEQWQPMAEEVQKLASQRMVMVWSAQPQAEAHLLAGPLGGALRQDEGDFVAVSEANMAPTSKFNLVVHRSDHLSVGIAADGAVDNSLALSWQNDAGLPGEPYATLREYSTSRIGNYGAYVRVLVPSASKLTSASGQADQTIEDAESVDVVAGRQAMGNFLLMPPGRSTLTYAWHSAARATRAGDTWTYRLTVQKQAGTLGQPLTIHVSLPAGAIVETPPVDGTVTASGVDFTATPTQDLDFRLEYRLP